MKLKKIAAKYITEHMEAWDMATETWKPCSFVGRIDLTDRFLSNFNKPTRRRMLFTDNDVKYPPSLTFRHPGTKEVYLLGTKRTDARDGNPYVSLTILQLVTDVPGGSSGLATITRKVVQGPPENPGWLVDTVFAKTFIDTEFLSSTEEEATTDLRIERYNAYLPLCVQPREWDFITLHNVKYRVLDTFADSGFFGLRIDHEGDYRSNFVLHLAGKRVMNPQTNEWEQTPTQYNVTGVMEKSTDSALWATDTQTYRTVYFEADHLPAGVDMRAKNMWLELNGVRKEIKTVETQSGKRQFTLRVV